MTSVKSTRLKTKTSNKVVIDSDNPVQFLFSLPPKILQSIYLQGSHTEFMNRMLFADWLERKFYVLSFFLQKLRNSHMYF